MEPQAPQRLPVEPSACAGVRYRRQLDVEPHGIVQAGATVALTVTLLRLLAGP